MFVANFVNGLVVPTYHTIVLTVRSCCCVLSPETVTFAPVAFVSSGHFLRRFIFDSSIRPSLLFSSLGGRQ